MKVQTSPPTGNDAARLLSASAQRDALRRRARAVSTSDSRGRSTASPGGVDDVVEAVTARVVEILRPEVRRVEQRLTRMVADLALRSASHG